MKKTVNPCNQSTYELLFEELVAHFISRKEEDIEGRLKTLGFSVGGKLLSLMIVRKVPLPSHSSQDIMFFLKDRIWQTLFNHPASLHESDEYPYILIDKKATLFGDTALLEFGPIDFVAGIIEGLLFALGLKSTVKWFFDHSNQEAQFGVKLDPQ